MKTATPKTEPSPLIQLRKGVLGSSPNSPAVCRREFLKTIGVALGTTGLPWGSASFGAEPPAPKRNRDRALGVFLGAAIGDAMGGPVEIWSAERIKKEHGEIKGFLLYPKAKIHPGAAMHPEAGSITDDTYIRYESSGKCKNLHTHSPVPPVSLTRFSIRCPSQISK